MSIWNENNGWLRDFLKQGSGTLGSQLDYAGSLEPARQAGINQFLAFLNPGNTEANIARQGRINNSLAADNALGQNAMMRAQGLGSGAIGGATQGAYNQAATATNQYANLMNSPEGKQQQMQAFLQAIGQGQSMPMLAPMLQSQGQWTDIWQILEQLKRQGKPGLFGQLLGTGLGMAAPGLSSWIGRSLGGSK